jgi:leucyl-tRNA synthetase
MQAPFGTAREELQRMALANDKVKPFIVGKQVVKVVVVPDRLVNIVVK